MSYLPFDYARCEGKPAGPQGLNFPEECRLCRRRTSAWGDRQSVMLPPQETPCLDRIAPLDEK